MIHDNLPTSSLAKHPDLTSNSSYMLDSHQTLMYPDLALRVAPFPLSRRVPPRVRLLAQILRIFIIVF